MSIRPVGLVEFLKMVKIPNYLNATIINIIICKIIYNTCINCIRMSNR